MLVLTRKVDDKIKIGDDIFIHVLEINKGNVRLGIDAPKQLSILRNEIYEKIQEENLKSSQGTSSDIERAVRLWREKSKG